MSRGVKIWDDGVPMRVAKVRPAPPFHGMCWQTLAWPHRTSTSLPWLENRSFSLARPSTLSSGPHAGTEAQVPVRDKSCTRDEELQASTLSSPHRIPHHVSPRHRDSSVLDTCLIAIPVMYNLCKTITSHINTHRLDDSTVTCDPQPRQRQNLTCLGVHIRYAGRLLEKSWLPLQPLC